MNNISKAASTSGTNILTGRSLIQRVAVIGDAGVMVDFYDFAGNDGSTVQVNLATGYPYKTYAEGVRNSNSVADYSGESLDYTYNGLIESSAAQAAGNVAIPAFARLAVGQDIPVSWTVAKGLWIKSTSGTPTVLIEYSPQPQLP